MNNNNATISKIKELKLHDMAHAFQTTLEDRRGLKSTVFISQLPVKSWHGLIGDSTIADTLMDRIVYGSNRIELKGGSFRRKKHQES